MKNKKLAMGLCTAGIGAVLLVTSALADMALGSGYQKLKDAVKETASATAERYESFSAIANMEVRIDETLIVSMSAKEKYDNQNHRKETITTTMDPTGTKEGYTYEDDNVRVFYEPADEKPYKVMQNVYRDKDRPMLTNPFEDEYAKDAERIVDAAVGNLQDLIMVEETDGKRIYAGEMTDAEIPALINAVGSVVAKYSMPSNICAQEFVQDVYIANVDGKAVENGEGILESMVGHVTIMGKDDVGNAHTMQIGMSIQIEEVNTTEIEPFDETRADAERIQTYRAEAEINEKYVGTYTSNIVRETEDQFEKVGERTLTITAIKDGLVIGTYTETKEGESQSYTVRGEISEETPRQVKATYKDENGEEKYMMMDCLTSGTAEIYISLDITLLEDGWTSKNDSFSLQRVF
ncbi:MAG: hypothetical protein PUB07_00480 [Clostridia bacterium]|nr:hypothetical protein [Clostridia bacterium]